MRVAQVIDTLVVGGAERMTLNIANAFNDNGIESIVIATRSAGGLSHLLNKNTQLKLLNKRFFIDIFSFYKFYFVVKKFKPDVLHCHSGSIYWGILIKRIYPDIMLIWHDHYGNSESLLKNDRKILRLLSSNIDRVIAVNEKLEIWSKQNLKISNKNIIFLNNFPVLNLQSKDVKMDDIVIIHLANFTDQKDHLVLVKAISILVSQNKNLNIKVLLVGLFNELDKYYLSVKQEIAYLRLQVVIEIMGPVNNVEKLLQNATIGILSSQSEGLPISLLEYGLAKLPVVCTNVGQCSEVLDGGACGWLVESKNAEEISFALTEIIQNKNNIATKKAKLLYERVKKNYGADEFIKKYCDFINQ